MKKTQASPARTPAKCAPKNNNAQTSGERSRFQVSVGISNSEKEAMFTLKLSGSRRKSDKFAITKSVVSSCCVLKQKSSLFWLENEFDENDDTSFHLTASVTFSCQVNLDEVELLIGDDSDFIPNILQGFFMPKTSKTWSIKTGLKEKSKLFALPSSPCTMVSVKFDRKDGLFCDFLPEIATEIVEIAAESSPPTSITESSKFDNCPLEILKRIIFHISTEWRFKALLALAGTCKRFRDIFKDAELWFSSVDVGSYSLVPPNELAYAYLAKRASSLKHLRLRSLKSFPAASISTLFNATPQLTTLILRDSGFVDDKFLDTLLRSQSLKQSLETLDVSGCLALTSKGFVKLGQFRQMKRFSAARLAYVAPGEKKCVFAQVLSQMKQLEVFDMFESKSPDLDSTCAELAKLNSIKAIRLGFGSTLTDSGLGVIFAKCQQLEELYIRWPVKRPDFSFLTASCPNLQRLSMNSAFDEDFASWAQFLPNLELLELREHSTFDISNVRILLDACSKLALLSVNSSSYVQPSIADLLEMRNQYPKCVIALHYA